MERIACNQEELLTENDDDDDDGYPAVMTIPILQVRILRTQYHTASKWWQVPLLPKGLLFQCYPHPILCTLPATSQRRNESITYPQVCNREESADTSALDMEVNEVQYRERRSQRTYPHDPWT